MSQAQDNGQPAGWLNGYRELVTSRYVEVQPNVLHFRQQHMDGPTLALTVRSHAGQTLRRLDSGAAEIHSVRPVVPDEAES